MQWKNYCEINLLITLLLFYFNQVLCCCCSKIRVTRHNKGDFSKRGTADDTSSRFISTNTGPRTVFSDVSENGRRKTQHLDAEQQATRTALLNNMSE